MVKGQLLYKNGDTYFGQIKSEGQISGQGVYKFSNGSLYEGYFENSLFHGRGKLVDNFNSITIIGLFEKGKAHGLGKIIYEDQSIYEGQLRDGLRSGKGRYIYAIRYQEKQYNGEFKNDQYEGQGILTYKNGDFCKGFFTNSLLNGLGEFKTKDFHIVGDFKNNLPHGKAKIKYQNGETYQGDFYQGKKQGYGVYKYSDNSIYKGNFVNDLMEGIGEIIYVNGEIFRGKFMANEAVNGQYYKGDWKLSAKLKNNEFDGFCEIKNKNTKIQAYYNEGQKQGFSTVVKSNSKGKEITFKSEFRKDKQIRTSISYSQRF